MEPGNDGEKIAKGRHRKTTPCCSNLVTELATTQRRKSVQRKQKKRKKKPARQQKQHLPGPGWQTWQNEGTERNPKTHTHKKKKHLLEIVWRFAGRPRGVIMRQNKPQESTKT